jgi:hypothetical protein
MPRGSAPILIVTHLKSTIFQNSTENNTYSSRVVPKLAQIVLMVPGAVFVQNKTSDLVIVCDTSD